MPPSSESVPLHIQKPAWLKTKITGGQNYFDVKRNLRSRKLVTVCEEAKCPNIGQCWNTLTATFMVLGDTCTRACRFCNIKTGNPAGIVSSREPQDVAESSKAMGLDYVVLTMVDRDDLADGGASHVAQVIATTIKHNPQILVEVLAGDFAGDLDAIKLIISQNVSVYAHNIETVRRLSPRVRDRRADYDTSLAILKRAHQLGQDRSGLLTKSALMVGLGETPEEVTQSMVDLRKVGCDLLTIGQYMRPSKKHLAIKEWVKPEIFGLYEKKAYELGFLGVTAKPLARSSFMAKDLYHHGLKNRSPRQPKRA